MVLYNKNCIFTNKDQLLTLALYITKYISQNICVNF